MRKDHYAEPASDNAQPAIHRHGASCIKGLARPGHARKPLKRYFNKNLSNYLQDKFDEELKDDLKDDIEEEFHDRAGRNRTQLRLQSWRAAAIERDDRPAKTNSPPMLLIRDQEPFQRVRRAASSCRL